MRYYIKRNEQEYGPYSEDDLRRYVSEGSIVVTDMARPENATESIPVSQILSPPQAPQVAPQPPAYTTPPVEQQSPSWSSPAPAPQQNWGTPGGGQPHQPHQWGAAPAGQPGAGPVPPDLHWALVLVIGMVCFIFSLVWVFIEANFVRKIDPNSKGMMMLIVGIAIGVVGYGVMIAGAVAEEPALAIVGSLICFGYLAFWIIAWFNMKASLENYYNSVEPYGLKLSGVMTFFFNALYFQHHFSKIAQWKKTGIKT